MCPSGQRVGLKYNSTDNKIVNIVLNGINSTIDSAQVKYLPCSAPSSLTSALKLPAAGTKCEDYRKKIEEDSVSGIAEVDAARKKLTDSLMTEVCLANGTVDIDKLAASSEILKKTFCV